MQACTIFFRQFVNWCLLTSTCLLVGCNGCRPISDDSLSKEELEKKQREQREALVVKDALSLPRDEQRSLITLKPGHWHDTTQQYKSTVDDSHVQLAARIYYGDGVAPLPSTNFLNEYTRKTTLPKGQEKTLHFPVYVPPTLRRQGDQLMDTQSMQPLSTSLRIETELRELPLMSPLLDSRRLSSANELKPCTFQLTAISSEPLAYQFLSNLDAVRWLHYDWDAGHDPVVSFEVSLVGVKDNQYAIPYSFLTMTSMAAIIWDDVSSQDLSDEQQKAIVDWIHWGGQLIINGPTSWTRLQGSFLSEYLPSNSAESCTLNSDQFSELTATWQTVDLSKNASLRTIFAGTDGISGLKFSLNERGHWLPGTGQLVCERSVGRGRVVVTAFSLRDPVIYNWTYMSSFLSTGLLRRPAREVKRFHAEMPIQRQVWASPYTSLEADPHLHSNLRILSRDLGLGESNATLLAQNKQPKVTQADPKSSATERVPNVLSLQAQLEPLAWSSVATWSDFSLVSTESVEALRAAAGIELPSRSTILKLLAGYLICLVPLNWIVFKLLRRLEYAWLAAPMMAVFAVVVVGKVAQLDIGFARRTAEISILEMFGDYPRAHLTQYLAMYTSLSTNYSIEFPEYESVALPMGEAKRQMRRAQQSTRSMQTKYGQADGVVLEPLTVYSNSTEMLHAEQMIQLGSPLRILNDVKGGQSIVNSSSIEIKSAILVRCNELNKLQTVWLGQLSAGEIRPLVWQATSAERVWEPWSQNATTSPIQPDQVLLAKMEDLWIGQLLHKIGQQMPIVPGQTRLIGYTQTPLGNLKISPIQDQYDRSSIVVAHLTPAQWSPVVPDLSIASLTLNDQKSFDLNDQQDSADQVVPPTSSPKP